MSIVNLALFISQYNIQVGIISNHRVDISPAPRSKSVSPDWPPSEYVHRTNIGPSSVYPRSPPREGQSESSSSFTSEREVSVAGECLYCINLGYDSLISNKIVLLPSLHREGLQAQHWLSSAPYPTQCQSSARPPTPENPE